MKEKSMSSISRLLNFAKPCKGKMVVSVTLAILGVMSGMLPYLSIAIISAGLFTSSITASKILLWVGFAVLGESVKMLLTTLSTIKSHQAAYTILEVIRNKLADKMLKVPMGVILNTPTGKLKSILLDTVERLEKPLAHMLPEITSNVMTPLFIVAFLFYLDWHMALASLVTIPLGLLSYIGMLKDYKAKSDRYITAGANMDSALVEYVNGIQVIKAFGRSSSSFHKFTNAVHYYHDTTMDWWKDTWLYSALGNTVIPAALVCSLPVGSILLMRGSISFSTFITCLILSIGIAGPIMQVSSFADSFSIVDAAIRQVGDFMDLAELERPEVPVALNKNGYVMHDISFGYGETEILHDISFQPIQGGTTAIVGPSGSGKSTIAKLMAGFWDVTSGSIIYGGKNIREIPIDQLMKEISFVSQDNFLFNISILENIRMGDPTASNEQVTEAAKSAQCHDFISTLEQGYDTIAGEAGARLSGGERQRIALARAMLRQSSVVILDEATAYADPENEMQIQLAIAKLVKGKTLIVIAHRLSTIAGADKIIVVDDGRIVGEGNQQELLDSCPLYSRMWKEHTAVHTGGEPIV